MKPNYFKAFVKGIILLQIFILIIIAGVSTEFVWYPKNSPFGGKVLPLNFSLSAGQAEGLVKETAYALASPEYNGIIQYAAHYYTEVFPREAISANIPVIAGGENNLEGSQGTVPSDTLIIEPEPPSVTNVDENSRLFGDRRVVCYCTHSSESYIPDSGTAKIKVKEVL
jgi:stage II sporulation protein P